MQENLRTDEAILDIRRMMAKSSRFISLSGLSGVSAGVFALIGAAAAHPYILGKKDAILHRSMAVAAGDYDQFRQLLSSSLFWIAAATFIAAFVSAFFFTRLKSKKDGVPIWGSSAKRLMVAVSLPVIAGGIFLFHLLNYGSFGLIAPGCLIFYGLGLVNAGKYTFGEISRLGYAEILLGIINLWFAGFGLYFWALGFGLLHIIYGIYMWQKYERPSAVNEEN